MRTSRIPSTPSASISVALWALFGLSVGGLGGCSGPAGHPAAQSAAAPGHTASVATEDHPGWTYPEDSSWGTTCEATSGPQQSPIDLSQVPSTISAGAHVTLTQAAQVPQGKFESHDDNVVFDLPARQEVTIAPGVSATRPFNDPLVYTPTSFHFHHGAEHIVRPGQHEFVEMHIKALDQSGNIAVFAVLMSVASSTDASLASTLPAIQKDIAPAGTTSVSVAAILANFAKAPFYTYLGSTTTPPCKAPVRWYVLQTPLKVTTTLIDPLVHALTAAGMSTTATNGNARSARTLAASTGVYLITPSPSQ